MGFVLELTREEANRHANDERAAVAEWLDRTANESLRRWGRGCWDIQLIRWDGESVIIFERHRVTGKTHWCRPSVPPPASLMRFARQVPR